MTFNTLSLMAGCSTRIADPTGFFEGNGKAFASATYDSLSALASVELHSGVAAVPFSDAAGVAKSDDVLTLPANHDGPVFLTFSWVISGSIITPGTDNFGELLFLAFTGCDEKVTAASPGPKTCTSSGELFPGRSVEIITSLEASVAFTLSGPGAGAATADFSHTAQLLPIQVFDANGNPITADVLQSQSGFQYAIAGAPIMVPEPSFLWLAGTALIAVVWLRTCPRMMRMLANSLILADSDCGLVGANRETVAHVGGSPAQRPASGNARSRYAVKTNSRDLGQ